MRVADWNPTGEEWIRADVLHEDAERAVIRLWENGQTLTAEQRHLRTVPRRCEADYNPDGGNDGVCLTPLNADGTCPREADHDDSVRALRGDTP